MLVDKIDILIGFWVIDEKFIGFKDFFVLCCVVLGVIWLVLENGLMMKLLGVFVKVNVEVDVIDLLLFFYDCLKVYLCD